MNRRNVVGIFTALVLVTLFVAGYTIPGSMNWGFHFLGFLPVHYFLIYLLGAVIIFLFSFSGLGEKYLSNTAKLLDHHPLKFLTVIIGLFFLSSYVFRISAPLLGDGFFLVRNFSEAFRGISPLYLRNEPLATYYYYGCTLLFGTSSFEAFLNSFWLASTFSGVIFLLVSYFAIDNLFEDAQTKLLTFLFVSTASYMQLFFGYVETYSVVLAVVSVYLLCSILFLKHKLVFLWVSISLFVACVIHYLALLLVPSFLYLLVREFRARGIKQIVIGIAIIAAGAFITFWLADFQIENLSSYVPHKHYLSLEKLAEGFEAYSQAYTLFSIYHLIDWVNLYILLCPVAIVMAVWALVKWEVTVWKSSIVFFLLLIVVPLVVFTFIAKYDLGAAKDWDVAASFIPVLIIFSCLIFFKTVAFESKRVMIALLGITMLNSSVWFTLNATSESAIARVKTLMDTSTVSQLGHYATSLHLAMYYHQMNNHPPAVEIWLEYSKIFPLDRRGYLNILQNIKVVNKEDYHSMKDVYESWLQVDSARQQTTEEFSKFCIEAGNFYFERDRTEQAKKYYRRATELTPLLARAYNNLGSVYAMQESTVIAISYFHRAIELDSTYREAMYNLGNAYTDSGDTLKAKEYFGMLEKVDTVKPEALRNTQ